MSRSTGEFSGQHLPLLLTDYYEIDGGIANLQILNPQLTDRLIRTPVDRAG